MDEIVPVMDRQMAMMLRNALKPVTFTLGAKVTSVDGHSVVYETSGGEKGAVEADVILMSVGERPTPKAGGHRMPDSDKEPRSRYGRESAHNLPGLWAIVDVTGRASSPTPRTAWPKSRLRTFFASRRGEHSARSSCPRPSLGLFSLPEAAGVGYTEDEAKAKG